MKYLEMSCSCCGCDYPEAISEEVGGACGLEALGSCGRLERRRGMSMDIYPIGGYGMALSEKEARELGRAWYTDAHGIDPDDADGEAGFDLVDLSIATDGTWMSGDELSGVWWTMKLSPGGEREECPSGLFLYAERQGSCVVVDSEERNYSRELYYDLDDMADEFQRRYGKYLPEGFDFVSHLAEFHGTVYC